MLISLCRYSTLNQDSSQQMEILKWSAGASLISMLILGPWVYEADIPKDLVDNKYTSQASQFLLSESGARIHFRDEGLRSGNAIVLIHGAMASLHTWEPWVKILGRHYRLITLDLPAHGLTGAVPNSSYTPDNFTDTISAVVDHLKLKKFTLGGNSMGGGVAWRYTLTNPERVQAMILIDSVGPSDWSRTNNVEQFENRRENPIGFSLLGQSWFRALARYLDPKLLIEQGLRVAYNNSPVIDQPLITRYYDLIMREGTREAILKRSGSLSRRREASVDLSQLDQPTLVMWGEKDQLIPVSVARQFTRVLPKTTLFIYPDLGHIPMEEDPIRTASDVLEFLAMKE